jgi:hypothetical protein
MDTDKAVVAVFALKQYTLTVGLAGVSGGRVASSLPGIACGDDCSEVYEHGTAVTLTATPDPGRSVAWSDACAVVDDACVVTMDGTKAVTATFALLQYDVTVAKDGGGTGLVTSDPAGLIGCGWACATRLDYGSVLTLTAAPDGDSTFVGWQGAGCSGTDACRLTVEGTRAVTATFALKQYPLSIDVGGIGAGLVANGDGSITCDGTCTMLLDHGAVVMLTASPALTSTFGGWGGACTGDGGDCVFLMDAARELTATFGLQSYPVAAVAAEGGSVSVEVVSSLVAIVSDGLYPYGTVLRLTAQANEGLNFVGWGGDTAGASNPLEITVIGPQTITAAFAPPDLQPNKVHLPSIYGVSPGE